MAKTAKTPTTTKTKAPTAEAGAPPAQTKTSRQLPNVFQLIREATSILGRHWKVFGGIALLYGVLNALLVRGFGAAGNLGEAKLTLDQVFTGNWGELASSFTLFAYLLGSSGNSGSPTAGVYQFVLAVIVSLALIWALRQLYAKHTTRVRDGFYRGMSPLIPFVLVMSVVALQLLPLAIGAGAYTTVVSNGIAVTPLEQLLWAVPTFGLTVLSLYLVSSSLFALYIVTLPDMTPVAALRAAKQLVAKRRWTVMRKILFLPLVLLLAAAVVIVPVILFATPLAAWLFFVLTMCLLPVIHSYMYALYRSML